MKQVWKPNTTVAAVIERDGHFLLVEEHTEAGLRLNQPAGHLEHGESLLDAVRREVLEETGRDFQPQGLVGVYLSEAADNVSYLRFTFWGCAGEALPGVSLDADILTTHWLSADEIAAQAARHRSPLVQRSLDDWLAGCRYPLALLQHLGAARA